MRLTTALLAATLVGCAAQPILLSKPGETPGEYDRTMAQCEYETSAATQAPDYGFRTVFVQELDREMRKRDLILKCMAAKGFRPQ